MEVTFTVTRRYPSAYARDDRLRALGVERELRHSNVFNCNPFNVLTLSTSAAIRAVSSDRLGFTFDIDLEILVFI